jgi:hypothetical protein
MAGGGRAGRPAEIRTVPAGRPWIGAFNSPIIDSSWADTEGWRYNSIGPRIKLEKAML